VLSFGDGQGKKANDFDSGEHPCGKEIRSVGEKLASNGISNSGDDHSGRENHAENR